MAVYGEIINEEAYLCEVAGLSKKDLLENPEKVESRLKQLFNEKFSSVQKAIAVVISLLGVVAGIASVPVTFGLSIYFCILWPILITGWIQDLDTKSKKNKIKRIKQYCEKIKTKYENYLQKNPNDSKCKEALDKISNTINSIDKMEKDVYVAKSAPYREAYKSAIGCYKNPSRGRMTENNDICAMLTLFKLPDIVKRYSTFVKFEKLRDFYGSTDEEMLEDRFYCAESLYESIKEHEFFEIFNDDGYDNYRLFIDKQDPTKLLYYFDDDPYFELFTPEKYVAMFWRKDEIENMIKRIDREEGYYLLSEPPKGIERKPVIEKK